MGYYTDYTLNVSGTRRDRSKALVTDVEIQPDLLNRICTAIEKMNVGLEGDPDMGWYVNAKWYNHASDMLALSKEFPTVLFTLSGSGEDDDDMWKHYFFNGMEQYAPAEIHYDAFSEQRLVAQSVVSDWRF